MLISIIIPVFNRERFINRCLASVFAQDFADFEVIAVDDGSQDGSLARLQQNGDPRLRVIAHGRNRGVGPARNTGIAAARGDWIIALDSDDELVPGALSRIGTLTRDTPASVHALWLRCRLDDGTLSLEPPPSQREWDYNLFIGFMEETRNRSRDVLRCVRRATLGEVPYPDNYMLEDKFHLDYARRFRSRFIADVVRLYHQDADNRLVNVLRELDPERDQNFVRDRADGFRDLLIEHGQAIARLAPGLYGDYLQMAATSAILAGRRFRALGYLARLIVRFPPRARAWLLAGAALAGPNLAQRVQRVLARRH
jgi:glycosyltransferase involved in cell wall biosynthesis